MLKTKLKLNTIFNFLKTHFKILLLLYFAVQLAYIIFYPINYQSDSLYYFNLAQDCLKQNSFYPAPNHIFEDYIIAPLYINILIIVLKIYNSKIAIGLLNIALNFTQLWLLYTITKKQFGSESAKVAGIIYIFYLSTLGMILFNLTEFLFCTLILFSLYFYNKRNASYLLLAGIFNAAAIAVRPLGWALAAAYLINYLLSGLKFIELIKKSGLITAGLVMFIIIFGYLTYANFGRFIFQSTNGPVNLLIAANDDATGAYNNKVFEQGKIGYIEEPGGKTYIEKEEFWKKQALNWIENNPVKYISLFPVKLLHMFAWDDFSVSKLVNTQNRNLYNVAKYLLFHTGDNMFKSASFPSIFLFFLLLTVHHLYYFSIIFLFGFMLIKYSKILAGSGNTRLMLLFILFGLAIHLLTFGDARYKYPYLILMILIISPIISNYMDTVSKQFEIE